MDWVRVLFKIHWFFIKLPGEVTDFFLELLYPDDVQISLGTNFYLKYIDFSLNFLGKSSALIVFWTCRYIRIHRIYNASATGHEGQKQLLRSVAFKKTIRFSFLKLCGGLYLTINYHLNPKLIPISKAFCIVKLNDT